MSDTETRNGSYKKHLFFFEYAKKEITEKSEFHPE